MSVTLEPPWFVPRPKKARTFKVVYALCNQKTNQVFYVGQTFDMNMRLFGHIAKWTKGTMGGSMPKVKILQRVRHERAGLVEKEWIEKLRSMGAVLQQGRKMDRRRLNSVYRSFHRLSPR